jgi:hypothetical protein
MARNYTRLRFESAAEAASLTGFGRLARVATAFVLIMHSFDVPNRRCLAVALTSLCAKDERRITQQKSTQPSQAWSGGLTNTPICAIFLKCFFNLMSLIKSHLI